ncbi:hypothetical protein GH714_012220 [Hevea brasiliensis]|uniref:Lipid desaturase domain-containing protein n=1 Tax=Hevea brasiliensis TaxID=3981 RepID=A0A6A6KIZ6_HEVBR|nr:hypothetical protein GH714_012220 [Hevea brasiliensis]
MSILPQHKYLTRSPTHVPNYHHLCPALVICSATTTKSKTKPAQLVTEPRLVNPPTLVTPIAPPVLNDRSLQSTWSHRIWVATGCTTVLISLAKAIVAAADSHIWLQPILAGYIGYILADLGSGVYHWELITLQFHAWAHGTKSKLPPLVVAMQDVGLLVSRAQHAAHHRPPYNNNYCIVSGVWNEFLDQQKVFEALEMILYFQLGVRPRSWSEPTSDWTEEVEAPS